MADSGAWIVGNMHNRLIGDAPTSQDAKSRSVEGRDTACSKQHYKSVASAAKITARWRGC